MFNASPKFWSVVVVACLAAQVLAALFLHQSFLLTAISDISQCILLLAGMISFVPRALRSQGRVRLFWSLITLGFALWLAYQMFWNYFEVLKRQEVPALFWGDIVLFLHIVPFMAAIAARPHLTHDEYAARAGRLDFAILIVWWIYLYVLAVLPWQYAVVDELNYSHNLNAIYLAEKIVFLTSLAALCLRSSGPWRRLYANFLGSGIVYSASSYIANWAIARNAYYSGSLYDIPLAASATWMAFIGLLSHVDVPKAEPEKRSAAFGVWAARCGMIAAISIPLFAAWVLLDTSVPARVRSFRLTITLSAALVMGVMAFVRQRLLDRELHSLLSHSRQSIENLKQLQAQVVQSEKLASIGQLVGGAAHELNNPITAMMGYSELLMNTPLSTEQQALAVKIGQQARRTRSLVASLLSFARPTPRSKAAIDLNTLLRTSIKLTQQQWQGLKIEVRSELDGSLPKVLGDSNQLLQVCLQIVSNALHEMAERGGRTLTVRTRRQGENAIIEVSEDAPAAGVSSQVAAVVESEDGLALSACQGIVQEHFGRLVAEQHRDGTTTIRIELPANPLPDPATMKSTALLAQSQPSA